MRFYFFQRVGHSSLRLASAETVQPAPAAVQPSILTIHCKTLNNLIRAYYPVHVFAKLQRGPAPPPVPPCSESKLVPLIQPLCPQSLTALPTQRQHRNSFGINEFRTLFIATEGIPPLFPFWNSSPSLDHARPNSFFSCTYEMQILQPLCFDIHANWWGYGGCRSGIPKEVL